MIPAFALLLAAVVAADEPLTVRLTPGQEIVYRGRFIEGSGGSNQERRTLELESRVFVLQTGPALNEVALQTVARPAGAAAGSARLELARVDDHGRVMLRPTGASPWVPLDGPPLLEPAGFVELPAGPIKGEWDVGDGPRPPRGWRVIGEEFQLGVRCLKLAGEQESDDWRRPDGRNPTWRRTDVVWLNASTGIVQRLERTIERRPAGAGATASVSRTEYERTESSVLPEQLAADLRREIRQTAEFEQKLTALQKSGGAAPADQFAALIDRIGRLEAERPTPYRPALVSLRHRAEAAMRGDAPPSSDAQEPPLPAPAIGRPGADFVTSDLVSGAPMRLARWRGRPAVLLFVRPDSTAPSATLRLAADLHTRYAGRLRVAVLVVSDEDRARPAWAASEVPLYAGLDAAGRYAVAGPSRVVVVDADGIIRHLGDAGPGVIDAAQRVVSGN